MSVVIPDTITGEQYIEAIGWISAELAGRADAWNGNAPDWFPEPPEWLTLAERAIARVVSDEDHASDITALSPKDQS
jgi:hypothetical protein